MVTNGSNQAGTEVGATVKYPLVMIEWIDAEHEAEWSTISEEETYELMVTYSIGWLIHEDTHRLILAGCIHVNEEDISNKQYIPIGMIVSRRILQRQDDPKWREMWDKPFDRPDDLDALIRQNSEGSQSQ